MWYPHNGIDMNKDQTSENSAHQEVTIWEAWGHRQLEEYSTLTQGSKCYSCPLRPYHKQQEDLRMWNVMNLQLMCHKMEGIMILNSAFYYIKC